MSVDVPGPGLARVMIDFDEVHNLSAEMLAEMHDQDVQSFVAGIACILSAGRIFSPQELNEDEELAFIQATLEWLGTYFADGSVN